MPTFDWRSSTAEVDLDSGVPELWRVLRKRFDVASDAAGVYEWTAFVESLQELAEQPQTFEWKTKTHSRLAMLIQQLRTKPAPNVATLFVSHQRHDTQWAEWVAWAATEVHFDYWLDVHDPTLTTVDALVLSPPLKSVLVAGIIEMALLNSTHVVSVQTQNAQSSSWVPYEFGRAKERYSLATNAASWFENGVAPATNGDYLSLAFCAPSSADLRTWLSKVGHTPPPRPNKRWKKPIPGSLPN